MQTVTRKHVEKPQLGQCAVTQKGAVYPRPTSDTRTTVHCITQVGEGLLYALREALTKPLKRSP